MTLDRHTETVRLVDEQGNPISAANPLDVTGGSGGTSMTDDAAFTPGSSSVTPMGAVYQATPDSVDDGDVGAPRMSANRVLMATGDVAHDAADSGNPVKVGGKYNSTRPVVADGDRADLQLSVEGQVVVAGNESYNSDAVAGLVGLGIRATSGQNRGLAAGMLMFNGSTFDRVRGDTTNGVDVDVTRSALPTGASTLAEQQSQTTALSAIQTDAAAIEVLLAAIDADTDAIKTAVQLLDNAISGNEMQVDIVAPLPAGTNLIGITSVAFNTDAIYQGTTSRTVGRAIIDAATSGNNTLLAAQGVSNKIRVHSLFLVAAGTVNVRFESGADGTALTGQMNLVANTGFVLPFSPLGWFETAANTLLNLELSGAVSVDGAFQYSVVQ